MWRSAGSSKSLDTPLPLVLIRASGDLSKAERLDYVNAVKCLQKKPPKTPAAVAAGAKSRVSSDVFTARTALTYTP